MIGQKETKRPPENDNSPFSGRFPDVSAIAREHLPAVSRTRMIFIVTDGFPDNAESAIKEAQQAARSGIEIMTLGTGDADLNFLNSLATKKEFSTRVEQQDLQQAIKNMARLLPGMK